MEDETVLRSLVYLLPKESVDLLLDSSHTLRTLVTRLEGDNMHWLRKVAYDFDLVIPEDKYYKDDTTPNKSIVWKDVHEFLSIPGKNLLLSDKPTLVQLGLDNGLDPSCRDNEAIRYAEYNGYSDAVKLLLTDNRVDPSDYENKAIRYAAYNGYSDAVKLLLQDGRADPTANNNEAILLACERGKCTNT